MIFEPTHRSKPHKSFSHFVQCPQCLFPQHYHLEWYYYSVCKGLKPPLLSWELEDNCPHRYQLKRNHQSEWFHLHLFLLYLRHLLGAFNVKFQITNFFNHAQISLKKLKSRASWQILDLYCSLKYGKQRLQGFLISTLTLRYARILCQETPQLISSCRHPPV